MPEGATKVTVGPLDHMRRLERGPATGRATDDKQGSAPRRRRPGEVVTELACNLADRRESDLRPGDGLPERPASLAAGLAVRPIWYYLLASAWLLTCWEWFLYQRRWID